MQHKFHRWKESETGHNKWDNPTKELNANKIASNTAESDSKYDGLEMTKTLWSK